MVLPVIKTVLHQLGRTIFSSSFKSSKLHRYELLPMASSNPTNREPEAPVGKADAEFSEDVEASRTSSKHDDNAHIHRVELTDEDVCLSLYFVACSMPKSRF
jgi:hypothetical protein